MTEILRIVPIDESHVPGFHAVWDHVAREKRFLALTEAPRETDVREFVLTNLKLGNPHLVALAGDTVVGWSDIVRQLRPTMAHRGALSVGLLPQWRCHGLGRRLVGQAITLAWQRGFRRIDLVSRADNAHAIALYERLGFTQEGIRSKAFVVDGHYYDLVDMGLLHPDLAEAPCPQ